MGYHKAKMTPDVLIEQLLYTNQLTTRAVTWGIDNETEAIQSYIEYQNNQLLEVFFTSIQTSFLGAMPDGAVIDLLSEEPYGLVEIKCPYI